ncbi:rhamnan synthesis F family protein [Ketogulonicigenium vulgare]|uniref:rhamnan synthesis F family protein n=1 Tax=Ketogulonicigenium vulgare TaxID=92945 RepID=UPI0023594A68|nr:rhamnan synthesis F family protein [Ketogulonicigenium vulgare]
MFDDNLFIHISVNALRGNGRSWGDTQFAEGLVRAIARIPGCGAALMFRGEVPDVTPGRDVVLRIVGPYLEEPLPDVPNILWMITPPNLATAGMLRRYQHIFTGAQLMTDHFTSFGIPTTPLMQATEPSHFHPSKREDGAADLPIIFVGSYAPRAERPLVVEAVQSGFDVKIWGMGWEGIVPDRYIQGTRVNYHELAALYARARVVLNSHAPYMAGYGIMSNRSYDALSAGAHVVSDLIPGYEVPDLPELFQARGRIEMVLHLNALLTSPPITPAARLDMHARVQAGYSFDRRAEQFVQVARRLLAENNVPPCAVRRAPARALDLSSPGVGGETQSQGMLSAAREITAIAGQIGNMSQLAPPAEAYGGVIHPLMADLRQVQRFARTLSDPVQLEQIAAGARRLQEVTDDAANPLPLRVADFERDAMLTRCLRNMPLWAHQPQDYVTETRKRHLVLQPRREAPAPARPIGVFLHLYYQELAPIFAKRLAQISVPLSLYVSTDTAEKAAQIERALPQAQVRVLPNRGRDIFPKLYGFGDAYADHDIVLHLHGKKSLHSSMLDEWLSHILDCLLGDPADVNRILSLFDSITRLGIVMPVVHRSVLNAAHWGFNRDIGAELAYRMGMATPLPENDALQFPAGSMFWARTAALQPILDLALEASHFPPEAGQVDGTLAHAVERMLGVVCRAGGYYMLSVAGSSMRYYPRYQQKLGNNRAVAEALAQGAFDVC